MNPVSIFQNNALPLEPLPTGVAPNLRTFPGIRAVVFDIYGTLVISGSGDIGVAQENDRELTMLEAFEACGIGLPAGHSAVVPLLHEEISCAHAESRSAGVDFPEVEIREIWEGVLRRLSIACNAGTVERLAVEYECRVNPVWPMPRLRETIAALRGAGMKLGIVSNAQFYTPRMIEAFLGAPPESLGFDPALCVWSYRERTGKPSVTLYEKLAAGLTEQGIRAGEVLYVGNDIRNDIWPAQRVGLRTALFAGDRRSLRLREADPLCSGVRPDVVVTDLAQLATTVGANRR